jgi:hypothetical protein
VLAWAEAVREAAEREPGRDELPMQSRAYIGGVLTTLDHLGLLTRAEYAEWSDRLSAALGDRPEGSVGG